MPRPDVLVIAIRGDPKGPSGDEATPLLLFIARIRGSPLFQEVANQAGIELAVDVELIRRLRVHEHRAVSVKDCQVGNSR